MTLQTASFRARPSVMVAALSTLNSENPPTTMAGDPKATYFDKQPRDLTDVYTGAVCVLVPKVEIDDKAALAILTGSTMNGRYIDEVAAKKVLADKKVYDDDAVALVDDMADKKAHGTGETSAKRFNLKAGNNWLHIGRHVEPRRIAGTPINRGEHVAVH